MRPTAPLWTAGPGWSISTATRNYAHETKGHSSTVKIAGSTRRVHAAAGDVFHANLTKGLAYTCSTYYVRRPGSELRRGMRRRRGSRGTHGVEPARSA
ncbi:lactococcin 972 family bacteriocin [Streptomyces sp. NPDC054840]